MGRRKIEIQPITHERNRSVTFLKRKNGLFKKAYELGVLCSVDVAVIIFDEKPGQHEKLYEYSSMDVRDIVKRHVRYSGEKDCRGPSDFSGTSSNKLDDVGEADDDDDDPVDDVPPPSATVAKSKPKAKQGNSKTPLPASRHRDAPSPVHSPPPRTHSASPDRDRERDRDRDRDRGRGRSPNSNPRKRYRESRTKSRSPYPPSHHSQHFSRADFSRGPYPPGYPYLGSSSDVSRSPIDLYPPPNPHIDISGIGLGMGMGMGREESMDPRMMYQQMMLQQQHQQQVAQRRERLAALQAAQAQAAGHSRPPRQSPIDGSHPQIHRHHSQDQHHRNSVGSTSASASASEISDLVAFFDAVDRGPAGSPSSPSFVNAIALGGNSSSASGTNSGSDTTWLDFLSNVPPSAPASTISLASSSNNPRDSGSWGRSNSGSSTNITGTGLRGGGSNVDSYMGMPSQSQLAHFAQSQYSPGQQSSIALRNASVNLGSAASRQQMLVDVFSGLAGGADGSTRDRETDSSSGLAGKHPNTNAFGGVGSLSNLNAIPSIAGFHPSMIHRQRQGQAAGAGYPGPGTGAGLVDMGIDMDIGLEMGMGGLGGIDMSMTLDDFNSGSLSATPGFGPTAADLNELEFPAIKKRRTEPATNVNVAIPESPASLVSDIEREGSKRRGRGGGSRSRSRSRLSDDDGEDDANDSGDESGSEYGYVRRTGRKNAKGNKDKRDVSGRKAERQKDKGNQDVDMATHPPTPMSASAPMPGSGRPRESKDKDKDKPKSNTKGTAAKDVKVKREKLT